MSCVRAEIREVVRGPPKASSLELHVAWREIRMREFMRMQMRYAQEHAPSDTPVVPKRDSEEDTTSEAYSPCTGR